VLCLFYLLLLMLMSLYRTPTTLYNNMMWFKVSILMLYWICMQERLAVYSYCRITSYQVSLGHQ